MTTQTLTDTKLAPTLEQRYEYPETRALVALVNDAAELVSIRGATAFDELRTAGSRWRQG